MAGFMRLQVWHEQSVYVLGDCHDVYRVPESEVGDLEIAADQTDAPICWWAEYSAPGYMDRTDPCYGDTAVEAARAAWETFGNDEDPAERAEFASVLWECRKADREVSK